MFADAMVRLFGEFFDEDYKELLRKDMEEVGPAEAVRYFSRGEGVVEGFVIAVQDLDPCMYAVLADARRRTQEAHRIAEGYASAG
jgi:hypothetical protein